MYPFKKLNFEKIYNLNIYFIAVLTAIKIIL